jgi:hypothetical protein
MAGLVISSREETQQRSAVLMELLPSIQHFAKVSQRMSESSLIRSKGGGCFAIKPHMSFRGLMPFVIVERVLAFTAQELMCRTEVARSIQRKTLSSWKGKRNHGRRRIPILH